jgi:hypothetical protein
LIKQRQGNKNAKGIVSFYDFNETHYAELKVLTFPDVSLEWLDLICQCRSSSNYIHGYDIVIGKVANDVVGEAVNFVVRGVMRREDALAKLRFQQINNQICFATEKALSFLQYTGCGEVG